MNKHILLLGVLAIGCGDDGNNTGNECGAGTTAVDGECVADAVCGTGTILMDGMCIPDGTPPTPVFRQIEHLARPGINEALLLTDGFLEGYNATAPSFSGVPQGTLDMVIGEAKTVLKALYLGGCLLNGVLAGVTAANGVKPAGQQCAEIGGALFVENSALGVTLKATVVADAQLYADRVFDQFVPDVMRINTAVASNYLTLCGSPLDKKPLLCGGRRLNDDVIDVTYSYLLNGAATTAGPPNDGIAGQVRALTSDGVVFDNVTAGNNNLSLTQGDASNPAQGHPNITTTFPYSAPPQ